MKAISVELNRRTHFLKAALCSQTWCHGMSGCMCTSHMHTGTLSALTLLFVCICELCHQCVLAFCSLVSPRLRISKCISMRLCVNIVIRVQIRVCVCMKQRGWGGQKVLYQTKYEVGKAEEDMTKAGGRSSQSQDHQQGNTHTHARTNTLRDTQPFSYSVSKLKVPTLVAQYIKCQILIILK